MSHDKPGVGDSTPARRAGEPCRICTRPGRFLRALPLLAGLMARDSPCLLVKGTDCAGVTRARGACGGPGLWCRCWVLLCQAVSRRTALCSYVPRANRAGGRDALWLHQRVPSIV